MGSSPATGRARRVLRRVLQAGLLAALLGVASLVAAAALLGSAWGRSQVASRVGVLLTDLLRGGFKIGEVREISPWHVVVRGVDITDPWGNPVVHADQASADVDLWALLSEGTLVLDNVHGEGGWASLHRHADELAIAVTFFPARPSPAKKDDGQGFVMLLRHGYVSGGRVSNLPGQPSVEGVSGSFSLSYRKGYRMTAQHVQADVSIGHGPARLAVEHFQLSVVAGEGSHVDGTLSTADETVRAEARAKWGPAGFQDVHGTLRGTLGPAWLKTLGQAPLADGLLAPLTVDLTAQVEQPARLVVGGQLASAGGDVTLSGGCTLTECELGARTQQLLLANVVRGAPPEPLRFDFDLQLNGQRFHDFALRVREAKFGALSAPAFATRGAWSPDSLTLSGLQGTALAIEPGSFAFELRSGTDQLSGKLSFRLSRLAAAADWGPLADLRAEKMRVQANGSYRPKNRALAGSLLLVADKLQRGDARLETLELNANLSGTPEQPRLSLQASAARIQAGQLPLENAELSLVGSPARFSLAGAVAHGPQHAKLALSVVRTPGVLRATGSAHVAGLPGAPLHVTLANAVLKGGTLELTGLEATLGAASLALSGRYTQTKDSSLRLTVKQVCIPQLAALAGDSVPWLTRLSGCAHGEAYLAGKPKDPALSAQLAVEDLTLDGRALGRAEASGQLAQTTREASVRLALVGPLADVRAQLSGKLPELTRQALLSAPYRAELHASAGLPELAPLLKLDASRVRDLKLTVDVSSDSQIMNGQLALSYAGKTIVQTSAHGQHAADGLQTGHLLSALDVDLALQQLPLSLLSTDAALAKANLVGNVQLRGLLTAKPRGELQVKVLGATAPGVVVPPLVLSASADPEALRLKVEAGSGSKSLLQVDAQLPWKWADPTHVALQKAGIRAHAQLSDVPLALLTLYAPGIRDARGTVTGSVALEGVTEQPNLTGTLQLRQGSFTLQDPFIRVERLEFALDLERTRVRLRDLKLSDQAGDLSAEGELQLVGIEPSVGKLKLSVHQYPLRREGINFAGLSAEINIDAQLQQRPMQIKVKLRELAVTLPADRAGNLQPLEQHQDVLYVDQTSQRAEASAQQNSAIPYEVVIDASQPFWIRRPGVSVELTAQLRLRSDAGGGSLTGVVQIRRGLLTLMGRGFELQRGSITFEGGSEIDPTVVLDAVHKLGDGNTVTASVRGSLSAPALTFTSSVPGVTTNAQALQLLMSGRDNTAGESAQAQVGSALAALTTGLFSKVTSGKYGKYVPVLSLESGASAGTRMRAGVQADDLIPALLQGIVTGVYLEGYVGRKNQGGSRTGAGGVLMELYFPRHLVTGGAWELPSNWSVEVTWEP